MFPLMLLVYIAAIIFDTKILHTSNDNVVNIRYIYYGFHSNDLQ